MPKARTWTRPAAFAAMVMLALGSAGTAAADIVVLTEVNTTGTEFIALEAGVLDATIFGTGAETGGKVTITGQEDLTVDAVLNRIIAVDGAFATFMIEPTHATNLFTKVVFNLNALADSNFTLKVTETLGSGLQTTFFAGASGQNFFTLMAIGSQITSVEISGVTLEDVRQLRIGFAGLPPTATPVPEPGAWGLMIAGFTMIGVMSRRRRQLTATVGARDR